MLSSLVGPVDWNAAAVLCVFFIASSVAACVGLGTLATRKNKRELELQYQIDQQKLANEDAANARLTQAQLERDLTKSALEKDVQFKRIDSGMIEGMKTVRSNGDEG